MAMQDPSREQQILANRLSTAIVDIDLQLYKASIYKLRWGSPGGLDQAIPCYRTAALVAEETPWPDELRQTATELAARVRKYIAILESRDVTTASAQQSLMIGNFEALRERVRRWPDAEEHSRESG